MNANVGQGIIIRLNNEDLETTEPLNKTDLRRILRFREESLENFRKIWHQDYHLSLRERTLRLSHPSFENTIKKGETVLVKDPLKTRQFWSRGEVLELIEWSDKLVRSAKVRKKNRSILIHSIKHLFSLEICPQSEEEMDNDEQENLPDQTQAPQPNESVRI